MWDIGDLLELSVGGTEVERLPWPGLPLQKGYNKWQTCVTDTVQHSGGQCHQNLAGHYDRGPEGGS